MGNVGLDTMSQRQRTAPQNGLIQSPDLLVPNYLTWFSQLRNRNCISTLAVSATWLQFC